jgi:hypothetical protein
MANALNTPLPARAVDAPATPPTARAGTRSAQRLIACVLAGYAAANLLWLAFLSIDHATFPLNLGPLELAVLGQVKRAMAGLPMYVAPSPHYVALAYNPLYYFWVVPFAWVNGATLATLRMVAILGMWGSALLIYLAVRRAAHSAWWGLMAVGLFAAAYRAMDAQLDNAHPDSWLLCMLLLGYFLIEHSRSRLGDVGGVLATILAFWFKQPGALFVAGALLYLTWRRSWRAAWPCWLLAMLLGPLLYVVAAPFLFGSWLHYFTWEVPHRWVEVDGPALGRLLAFVARTYPALAAAALASAVLALPRLRDCSIWLFTLPIAVLSGVAGVADPGSNDNVLIPMGVWLITTGVLGCKQILDRRAPAARFELSALVLAGSFAVLAYNPLAVLTAAGANAAYDDLVRQLGALDGPVYAPWLGQLAADYQFSPTAHWVALEDMVRGPGVDVRNQPLTRRMLEPVLQPQRRAYLLTNDPLESDSLLAFLGDRYVLEADYGERFKALATLPKRYEFGWPRYLYRYAQP